MDTDQLDRKVHSEMREIQGVMMAMSQALDVLIATHPDPKRMKAAAQQVLEGLEVVQRTEGLPDHALEIARNTFHGFFFE